MSSKKVSALFIKKRLFGVSALVLAGASLSSCDLAQNYAKPERAANMEIQDFRDGLAERLPEIESGSGGDASGSIPELQPYVTETSTSFKPMPLVSVSVNQSVPVRDILYELAEQADYDIELDPNIRGSIIFSARNKPFDVVIERISKIAGLRYKFQDDYLRVELDTPYNKTYKVDYLSFIRENSGSVSTNVSVVTGEGADTGSSYSASTTSDSDFWGEMEGNLTQILGGGTTGALRTRRDPRITAVEQNPEVAAVAPTTTPAEGAAGAAGQAAPAGQNVQVQPPEAVLRVESLPVEGEEEEQAGASGQADPNAATFSINKQAGMINVYASEKEHAEVEKYLKLLRRAVTSQVLIEAKIFEVNLFDEYVTGIDWRAIGTADNKGLLSFITTPGATALNALATTGGSSGLAGGLSGASLATTSGVAIGYAGHDLQALIRAISGFGTVRALASPRLTALNNQSAVLNVATNRVFFEVDVDSTDTDDDGDIDTVEVDTTVNSVPEGVLVNVQPSINLDNGTISMSVRPTITRIVNEIADPGVAFVASSVPGASALSSLVPEVNVQEIDTVVNVRSGQPIVMGGLLQDRSVNIQEGVPVLGEMPIIGNAFRKKDDSITKTELVIFLKATIIEAPEDTIDDVDRDMYRAFSGDRHPLKL